MRCAHLATLFGLGLAVFAAAPAIAGPFGPATASIAFTFSPTVSISAPNSTSTLTGQNIIFSTSGSLANTVTGSGTSAGTLSFSDTVGITIDESVSKFLSFADTSGGTFDLDVTSVGTTGFSVNPGVSTNIALYVLGTMGDSHLGLTPSPTSVTITINSTGSSAYSASATLANPPAPPAVTLTSVPEPMSLAILGSGLMGLVVARRRV